MSKRNKNIITIVLFFIVSGLVIVAVYQKMMKNQPKETFETFNVTNDGILTWNAITGATFYHISMYHQDLAIKTEQTSKPVIDITKYGVTEWAYIEILALTDRYDIYNYLDRLVLKVDTGSFGFFIDENEIIHGDSPYENGVESIEVFDVSMRKQYTLNQTIDLYLAQILVYYDDETSEYLPIIPSMVSGFDTSSVGVKTMTITYRNASCQFTYEVISNE